MAFSIVYWFVSTIIEILKITGYFGIFIMMTLESVLLPVPSEVVLPFAGYLVYMRSMNLMLAVVSSTVGCLAGSLISYAIGYYGGRAFVIKYGKYVMFSKNELDLVENWFEKYGPVTVFVTRLFPVFRTFISLPAGLGKMNIYKFSIYTTIGSFIWSFALVYIGFLLGKRWIIILQFFSKLDYVVYAVGVGIFGYLVYRAYNAWNKNKKITKIS